jgi:hypothetical protein
MNMEHATHPSPPTEGHGPGYETRDANTRRLLQFGAVLIVFMIAVELGMWGLYEFFLREREPEEVINPPVNLYEQLRLTRGSADDKLSSYGWVDRKEGVVRIPVDRAMELVAKRGVPKGKGPRTEAELNSHHGTPAKAEKSPGKAEGEDKKK